MTFNEIDCRIQKIEARKKDILKQSPTLKNKFLFSSNTSSPSFPRVTSFDIVITSLVRAHVKLVDAGSLKKSAESFSFIGLSKSVK